MWQGYRCWGGGSFWKLFSVKLVLLECKVHAFWFGGSGMGGVGLVVFIARKMSEGRGYFCGVSFGFAGVWVG